VHPRDIPILELDHVGLRSVAQDDARWAQLDALLAHADEHKIIGWAAIFDGAFTQSTGEVGPTGKTRGWRIHELRRQHLVNLSAGERLRPVQAGPQQPPSSPLAAVTDSPRTRR
jgi:hypothetical protein